MPKGELLFRYLKLLSGLIITFLPFGFNTPWKEIITGIGALIILASGLKVSISPSKGETKIKG